MWLAELLWPYNVRLNMLLVVRKRNELTGEKERGENNAGATNQSGGTMRPSHRLINVNNCLNVSTKLYFGYFYLLVDFWVMKI